MTPSCSPNPRALSEAQPNLAKNLFLCKTQMAFTTSKLASSKAPNDRAIAQDKLFKKLILNSPEFKLQVSFVLFSSIRRFEMKIKNEIIHNTELSGAE